MIKAIIYDLDDLMVNSNPLHIEAWDILLSKFNYKLDDLPKEFHSKFIGMRVIDISKEIIKALNLNVEIESFYKERINIFLELVREKVGAMSGLLNSLKLVKEKGLKIAIASSGTKEYIQLILSKFDINDYFDTVVSGDDVKIGKPDPETYLVIAKKLGFKAEECLVLEDATAGIESAKAAGCKCIAVRNPNTPPQNYSKADKVINSLKDLTLNIINSF